MAWLIWAVLGLILSFFVWDLYPFFEINLRQARLREIATPGERWVDIERNLVKEHYRIFSKNPTKKYIEVRRGKSFTMIAILELAYKLDMLKHTVQFLLPSLNYVELDKDEVVLRVEKIKL